MKRFLRDNGLSVAMFSLFLLAFAGQALAGWRHEAHEREGRGQAARTLGDYLGSGHFIEATFENWESEFLQMAAFVWLAAMLRQKGSAVSREPGSPAHEDPPRKTTSDSPAPVHRGGLALALYRNSLSLTLVALFAFSFAMHALGGWRACNDEARAEGEATVSLLGFVGTSTFWFESFQNWQSEFLSVGVLIVLSIFLRQQGSPESKPVKAPHAETGGG